MVDFNNEGTVTTPVQGIIKIVILEKRYNFLQAVEEFKQKEQDGKTVRVSFIKSRLYNLFLEIDPTLRKNHNNIDKETKSNRYTELVEMLESDKFEVLMSAFSFINFFLYDLGLLKFDNKIKYNTVMVEEENKAKNL